MPRLLWHITVAAIAKQVKMKRMKVWPSVIMYLSGTQGASEVTNVSNVPIRILLLYFKVAMCEI